MTVNSRIEQLQRVILPARQSLLAHSVYAQIDSVEMLRLFMESHVFAVWDFMSLLKSLQARVCCNRVPWLPPKDAASARLINEIVLAEETDEDGRGGFGSHYDLYHSAMKAAGADTRKIDHLLMEIASGKSWSAALTAASTAAELPVAVKNFVSHTFQVIEQGDDCEVAAAFTFGREDLLPDVFQRIVDELHLHADGLDEFKFYLDRHIELDADEHGPMAMRLISSLCSDDDARWQRAETAALRSLQARHALWDAMYVAMFNHRQAA